MHFCSFSLCKQQSSRWLTCMKVRNNWGEQKKKKCCVSLVQALLLLKVKRQFQYKKSKGQDRDLHRKLNVCDIKNMNQLLTF